MKKFIISALSLCLLLVLSCTEDKIDSFEGENGVTFIPKSSGEPFELTYSFLGNATGEYIQEVDVQIIGRATSEDRFFNVKVTDTEKTTANNNQYEILKGEVKANEYEGKLYVKLLNSSALDESTVSINLELIDSEDFNAGVKETKDFTLAWTNQIVLPPWRWYGFFFVRTPSKSAYQAIVETTGLVTFERADLNLLGLDGARALGTKFGDYVKQYNLDNPGNPLLHSDGDLEGQEIVPLYYTKSKFD